MPDDVRLTVPIPPYALGQNGSRVHWSKRTTVKRDYQEAVWIAGHGMPKPISCPWEFVAVEYDWFSCNQVDLDNIVSRMKYALDVLTEKGLNVIINDKGVYSLTTRWHKAPTRKDEEVIVTITRWEAPNEHEFCHPEFHRCDGGGAGMAHAYDDNKASR